MSRTGKPPLTRIPLVLVTKPGEKRKRVRGTRPTAGGGTESVVAEKQLRIAQTVQAESVRPRRRAKQIHYKDLVGSTITKTFENEDGDECQFKGEIESWQNRYYHIVYTDGDSEDMTYAEVVKYLDGDDNDGSDSGASYRSAASDRSFSSK